MQKHIIKLLFLGDPSVGKTSLISSIISEMSTDPVKTMKKVVLPPDMCLYSKDTFTELIDTSEEIDLQAEVNNCDLILLMYDASSPESIQRLETFWMKAISTANRQIPVILVGNKLDKIELDIDEDIEHVPVRQIFKKLFRSYKQLILGIECSAYYNRNIQRVLNSAQRAILYPFKPLYDLEAKQITPKFRKALIRIFRILDKELVNRLTDEELMRLQERVFQADLSKEDILAIKQIIKNEEEEMFHNRNSSELEGKSSSMSSLQQKEQPGKLGGSHQFINVEGFIAFQKKCIEMLKIQICWSILKYFNYSQDLYLNEIGEEFIFSYDHGESLELTDNPLTFLNKIYAFAQKYRSLEEGQSIIEKVFECSPEIPEQFVGVDSLQKFVLTWHLLALQNYRECYKSLLYIGYESSLEECFRKTRSKESFKDLLKLKERNVFSVLLVEGSSSGNNEGGESSASREYLKSLFIGCLEQAEVGKRCILFSNEKQSFTLILLKVKRKHLSAFFQGSLSNKMDLVIYFQRMQELENPLSLVRQKIAGHTMLRRVTEDEASNRLKVNQLPSLNLHAFPVMYNSQQFEPLFALLLETFTKIELGYSKEKIQKLKSQNERFQKIVLGVGGTLGAVALGLLLLTKRMIR